MQATLDLDMTQFRRAAQRLLAVKRITIEKLISDQARLFVRDAIKLTPPFGPNAITESYAAQRRIGEAAVRRDIGKVFQPLTGLNILRHPRNARLGEALQSAARSGDLATVILLLERAGLHVRVVQAADPGLHRAARTQRGRVRFSGPPLVVMDARGLKKFIESQVSQVGKTKGGWLAAADALGVTGIPAWITRHKGQIAGLIQFDRRPDYFAITIGNLVQWSSDVAQTGVLQAALENRTRAMNTQAEILLKRELERAAA